MDFLIGLSSVIPMVFFNKMVLNVVPKVHPHTTMGMIMIMLVGTGVISISWTFGLQSEITNNTSFVMGVGLALFANMISKILYLLQKPFG
jgi:uncharacterized membrane protein